MFHSSVPVSQTSMNANLEPHSAEGRTKFAQTPWACTNVIVKMAIIESTAAVWVRNKFLFNPASHMFHKIIFKCKTQGLLNYL